MLKKQDKLNFKKWKMDYLYEYQNEKSLNTTNIKI